MLSVNLFFVTVFIFHMMKDCCNIKEYLFLAIGKGHLFTGSTFDSVHHEILLTYLYNMTEVDMVYLQEDPEN